MEKTYNILHIGSERYRDYVSQSFVGLIESDCIVARPVKNFLFYEECHRRSIGLRLVPSVRGICSLVESLKKEGINLDVVLIDAYENKSNVNQSGDVNYLRDLLIDGAKIVETIGNRTFIAEDLLRTSKADFSWIMPGCTFYFGPAIDSVVTGRLQPLENYRVFQFGLMDPKKSSILDVLVYNPAKYNLNEEGIFVPRG